MLKVLCKDSTSIYRVDLMNDRAEIVKIEEHSTQVATCSRMGKSCFPMPRRSGITILESHERTRTSCNFLDAENLMRELRTKDRVSRRYPHADECHHGLYEYRPTARGRFG